MIDAGELRIGNYIRTVGGSLKYWEVKSDDILIIEKMNSSIYEPIAISEEWLFRFGFASIRGEGWFMKQYFTDCEYAAEIMNVSINSGTGRFSVIDADEDTFPIYSGKVIKSVHQLQNLYFALTGEELTLKND